MKTEHKGLRIAGAVLGAALAVLAVLPERAVAGGVSPFGFAIDSAAQQPEYETGIAGVRLALFGAANRYMYGLSLAAIANGKSRSGGDGDLGGLQIAALINDAYGAEFGAWQIAGFVNIIRGGGGGLVQLAGCSNLTEGPSYGLQLAGLFNAAEGEFSGVQLAGVCNVDDGNFAGVQLAAINVVKATVTGIQIGAINYAKTLHGIQIGAINAVGRDSGLSLGVININNENSAVWPLLRAKF